MNTSRPLSRRQWLVQSGALLATGIAGPQRRLQGQTPGGDDFVVPSPALPQPRVVLPTDALPAPQGPRKRIAAVTTAYYKYSHADDIITKFIEGYSIVGRTHQPHCTVVSLYIEQFPETDIGRGMAARYRIPLCDTPAQALTLGGDRLAVDGVLLIGEHGDYPTNDKGQTLYPRHRLFQSLVEVFRRHGRGVPVYNDKHLSYSWDQAHEMYQQSRQLDFAMMAGSSVPVTWRRPPLAFRHGIRLDAALSVGYGGLESYGFHTLELLQTFVEKRHGGETGVRAVQTLAGQAAWDAARHGRWSVALLQAAARAAHPDRPLGEGIEQLQRQDPEAVVFLIEYADDFQAAAYMSRRLVSEFCFAASVPGRSDPLATWCYLPKPQRDHFSFLCNHIEVMFRTGRPSYPVERTLLVTGVLEALMDSHFRGGVRIQTPHLATLKYQPADDLTAS
jgi:hypothetical protein